MIRRPTPYPQGHRDVLEAIIAEFGEEMVVTPTNEDRWRELAEMFGTRWNFHHAVAALDGITYCHQGSMSDCAVFNQSDLKHALDTGTLGLPAPEPLPGDDHDIPYFLVGDDA